MEHDPLEIRERTQQVLRGSLEKTGAAVVDVTAIETGDLIRGRDFVKPAGKKAILGKAFLAGTRWGK